MADQFLWGIFCDDARREINGKATLVGCYGPDMLVSSFPALLAKLVINWHAVAPLEEPFTSLRVKLMRGDDVLVEMTPDSEGLVSLAAVGRPGRTRMMVGGIMELHFFEVSEPCVLELRGEYNGGQTLVGPKLFISSAQEMSPT